ncbi:hypothetical protein FRB99_006218 [Tulasnella sp. 403]|nr:hypothetical protein FRB99_006218 [Tulasnella sp. 403]
MSDTPGLTQEQIQESTNRIREALRSLRLNDVASLTQHVNDVHGPISARVQWFRESVVGNTKRYFTYLRQTWTTVFKSVRDGSLGFPGSVTTIFFAITTSFLLAGVWLWCLISTAPPAVFLYKIVSTIYTRSPNGISLVNFMNPNIFRWLTQNEANFGKAKLATPPNPNGYNPRTFDLDIAKLLMQISALMYERDNPGRQVVSNMQQCLDNVGEQPPDPAEPEHLLVGGAQVQHVKTTFEIKEEKSRGTIDQWAAEYDVCFEPVSELASLSQAFCSVFWDPASTWIVVAFKGTDPRSFQEWVTDFTVLFTEATPELPDLNWVHQGFKERLFPSGSGNYQQTPWDTIAASIQVVADELARFHPKGTKCNVWFTGHSLGTAIATMAYAKILLSLNGKIGENAILRDAYLFATPVTVDFLSRMRFNSRIYVPKEISRTIWRVTNRDDFVATGLPSFGDLDDYDLGSHNLLGFSHLGIELFMKTRPESCQIEGNIISDQPEFGVEVGSNFSPQQLVELRTSAQKRGLTTAAFWVGIQKIPILGRFAAHAGTNYYDQLDLIATGQAVAKQ